VAIIPKPLHEHINSAFPANVCLVATVLPSGFAQVSPRGSAMVYDDEHLALWERARGPSTPTSLTELMVTVSCARWHCANPAATKGRHRTLLRNHDEDLQFGPGLRRNLENGSIQPEKDRDPLRRGSGC